MSRHLAAAIALFVISFAACLSAAEGPLIDHCYVSLIDDVQISAQEAGLLVPLRDDLGRIWTTREGQDVKSSALIAQVDDRQPRLEKQAAQAELRKAQARADDEIEVRYSEAAYRVAQAEFEAAIEVNSRVPGTVPRAEVRRLELTQHRAKLQIERSKMEVKVAGLSAEVSRAAVDAAEAAIARRQIISPVDGLILTVHKQPGEWVQAGEPVVQVAGMGRLRVEGFLSAKDFNASEIAGQNVTVFFELARGRKMELPGKVTFVSPLVQAGNRYRVRAQVQNAQEKGQWLLRPGMAAKMRVHVK